MKLVRKIKFKRAKELSLFNRLEKNFLKVKELELKSQKSIKNDTNFSELNFFLVLEYVNLVKEKIDYEKIFLDASSGKNSIVDFKKFTEEQKKLRLYIDNKNKTPNKNPNYFKRLGELNEVVGCYMIATTYKHIRKIKSFDFKKSSGEFVVSKFNFSKLPNEFEKICLGYSRLKSKNTTEGKDELRKLLSATEEERDVVVRNFMNGIKYNFLDFKEKNQEYISSKPATATTIQFAVENTLGKIQDVDFLEYMLSFAENRENYEFCAKIRDRLFEIKK